MRWCVIVMVYILKGVSEVYIMGVFWCVIEFSARRWHVGRWVKQYSESDCRQHALPSHTRHSAHGTRHFMLLRYRHNVCLENCAESEKCGKILGKTALKLHKIVLFHCPKLSEVRQVVKTRNAVELWQNGVLDKCWLSDYLCLVNGLPVSHWVWCYILFLCTSLTVVKGTCCGRLCHDIVGWLAVSWSRSWVVAERFVCNL